jgi:hypothetical protein
MVRELVILGILGRLQSPLQNSDTGDFNMAMTPQAVVSALQSSERTSVIHVRSSKTSFQEILNDVRNVQNGFKNLEFDSAMSVQSADVGASRLVIILDRADTNPANSPQGEQLVQGATVATLARRV